MSKIYLREEQQENSDYNIDITISKKNNIIIGDNYNYRRNFRKYDIVTANNKDFGYVYLIDEENKNVKVEWGFLNEWQNMIDLLIIPHEYGLEALRMTVRKYDVDIANDWIKLINGFSGDVKEYLFNNYRFPIVDFIRCDNDKLYDEKIDRNVKSYREIGQYKLFKASLFDGCSISSWDKVFYILDSETGKVYFGGINDDVRVTLGILYNKVERKEYDFKI